MKLGIQLFCPRHSNIEEDLKPTAKLWTSTAEQTENGYTSDWIEWCKHQMPHWVTKTGILYQVNPNAKILQINTDKDAIRVAMDYGIQIKDSMDLFFRMPWDRIVKDYDAIHHVPKGRFENFYMSSWDVESTAWINTDYVTKIKEVKIDMTGIRKDNE